MECSQSLEPQRAQAGTSSRCHWQRPLQRTLQRLESKPSSAAQSSTTSSPVAPPSSDARRPLRRPTAPTVETGAKSPGPSNKVPIRYIHAPQHVTNSTSPPPKHYHTLRSNKYSTPNPSPCTKRGIVRSASSPIMTPTMFLHEASI